MTTATLRCPIAARKRNDLTRDQRSNQLVECGCRDCREALVRFNRALTDAIVTARPVPGYSYAELHQEAAIALVQSIEKWSRRGNWTPYYVTTLRNHFGMLARAQNTAMRRPPGGSVLSLDSDADPAGSVISRLADKMDVAAVVEARLRILAAAKA